MSTPTTTTAKGTSPATTDTNPNDGGAGNSGLESNRKFNSSTMHRLMYLDPPKYGWTAIGGVATMLTPHEMARRPEAKEEFLKRQKEAEESKTDDKEAVKVENHSYTIEIVGDEKSKEEGSKKTTDAEASDATKSNEAKNDGTENNEKVGKDQPKKKISIKSTNEDGIVDIYTYHRGRVGEEPRDEKTGELLCDMDPVDTNHDWLPPKTVVKVAIKFPLADPDDDYVDSDLDEGETKDDVKEETGEEGGGRESRTRATRSAQSPNISNLANSAMLDIQSQKEASVPYFRDTIEWDLADPSNPQPLEYASNIGAEFGLNFTQTMELADSIQRQLDDFLMSHNPFFAPIVTMDPYGSERPSAHFGPPEAVIKNPAMGSRGNAGASGAGGRRNPAFNRSSSGMSRRSTGSSAPKPARPRPFKMLTEVVPKDQVPVAGKEGDKFTKEVLKRAKAGSQAKVRELLEKNEEALTLVKNENCHICHVRRDIGLMFHCKKHVYCDNHCATRLSCRAREYDPKDPKNIPVDHCPVCCVACVCAKCTRRLEKVTSEMKTSCEQQNCGPEDVNMDVFEKCSGYSRLGLGIGSGGSSPPSSAKPASKKARIDTSDTASATAKNSKRGRSSRSSQHDDGVDPFSKPSERRASKKRKIGPELWGVVKKVRPEEFPKEMSDGKDMDPSGPDDYSMVFTPEGAFAAETVENTVNKESYQKVVTTNIAGNFSHCFACQHDDSAKNLVFCCKCPRAFHLKCLRQDGCEDDINALPEKWQCQRCHIDKKIHQSEKENTTKMEKTPAIEKAFAKLQSDSYYQFGNLLLNTIYNILNALKRHDHGILFLAPVDTSVVKDYTHVVSKPMDYGTITTKLERGNYIEQVDDKVNESTSCDDVMSPMQKVLFLVLRDIEQVHHNCLLYNRKGSNYYRCGEVHRTKWLAYYKECIEDRAPDMVKTALNEFRKTCKAERHESSRVRHFQVPTVENGRRKPVAVFDPNRNMIVKQYSSFTAATEAANILKNAGYECEININQRNAKDKLKMTAEDPSKLIFGYRWIYTEDLKNANFKVKEKQWDFQEDSLKSPTPVNIAILRKDNVSGTLVRGFESEQAAFENWLETRAASVNLVPGAGDMDDFVNNFLGGTQSIDGIVWERVPNKPTESHSATGKMVLDQVYAESSDQLKHDITASKPELTKSATTEETIKACDEKSAHDEEMVHHGQCNKTQNDVAPKE